MARLHQLNPGNYGASPRISEDFENIVRYLVAAEKGNKTLAEMLAQLFDSDGDVTGLVELRLDQSEGFQYRVGAYTDDSTGWVTLASLSSLRGNDGEDLGTIVLPILTSRQDYTGDGSETDFAYVFDDEDEVLSFVNGVLQREGALYDYTLGTNEVIFNSAVGNGDDITFFKIRSDPSIGTTRADEVPLSTQSVFAYSFPSDAYELFIFKNGILLREGASYDYITSIGTSTVTFNTPITTSDTVTFLEVVSTNETTVTGLMTEEDYVDQSSGQINYDKLSIADDQIPQAKVTDLATDIAARAVLVISATEPSSPSSGNLWLDTSVSPNVLRFYDGVRYNATSPENAIPDFDSANAGQYVRVNGTGTALTIQDVDLSGLVPTTQKGAANGVASLDSNGQVPEAQMPEVRATDNLYDVQAGAVSNGNYVVTRSFKQTVRITGLSAVLSSGTCSLQLRVNGTLVGPVYSISSTALDQTLATQIEVDTTTASKDIGYAVSSGSSPNDLLVTLTTELLE